MLPRGQTIKRRAWPCSSEYVGNANWIFFLFLFLVLGVQGRVTGMREAHKKGLGNECGAICCEIPRESVKMLR